MAIVVETWMAEDLDLGVGDTTKTHPSGGSLEGYQISLSTFSIAGGSGTHTSQAWSDLASIDSGSYQTKDVTIQGAALGDFVMSTLDADVQDLMMDARVTATNTVTVVMFNPTGSAIDLGTATTIKILVFKTR
jgi:hypothetical protein